MITSTNCSFQLIAELHGANVSEEFDRVNTKLSDTATPAEIIRLYQVEVLLAERLISAWKKQFPKAQRPIQYAAKKELISVLKDEIAYWQGGADWTNATSTPAAEAALAATEQPRRATKKQVANLLPPLTMETVEVILAGLQIEKPGEWAAALSALVASGKLKGDPSKVHRWFEAANIGPVVSLKTVANKMEIREGGQFSNPSEKRIFNEVLRRANDIR